MSIAPASKGSIVIGQVNPKTPDESSLFKIEVTLY